MGRALAEAFPESRAVFEEADDALGFALSRLCFAGPAEALALTENTQPALLATSVAALRALEAHGVEAAALAGHSLGEWSAHVAAGTIGLGDALRSVRQRGRFMQEAVALGAGAMAAILGLEPHQVEQACREAAGGEIVQPANFNGPGQVVIAGHTAAVERASDIARRLGSRRVVALEVSAPFHCTLMEPAAERLGKLLETVELHDPRLPVYANVDARPVRDAAAAARALVRQVSSPVRWQQVVRALADDGHDVLIEVGPGTVLAGLARRIRKGLCALSVGDPAGVEAAAGMADAGLARGER